MKLENIFENDLFIIYQDNKGYDFAYDIENKTDETIKVIYGDYDEEFEIKDWVGLFIDEKYLIDCLINGNYKVV